MACILADNERLQKECNEYGFTLINTSYDEARARILNELAISIAKENRILKS